MHSWRSSLNHNLAMVNGKVAGWTPDYLDQILNEKVR